MLLPFPFILSTAPGLPGLLASLSLLLLASLLTCSCISLLLLAHCIPVPFAGDGFCVSVLLITWRHCARCMFALTVWLLVVISHHPLCLSLLQLPLLFVCWCWVLLQWCPWASTLPSAAMCLFLFACLPISSEAALRTTYLPASVAWTHLDSFIVSLSVCLSVAHSFSLYIFRTRARWQCTAVCTAAVANVCRRLIDILRALCHSFSHSFFLFS